MTLPLSGSVVTSSGFGTRDAPLPGASTTHQGIDYAVPTGTPVLAAGDGVVTFAGVQQGYGNVVQIDNGNGISTLYAHLSSLGVTPGQSVSDGEQIALSGATGQVTGPHLHFGVYVDGVAVDPTQYLTGGGDVGSVDYTSGESDSSGSGFSFPSLDFSGASDDLQAALAAPDLSTAASIVGSDPVLMIGGAVLAGLLLYAVLG